MADLNRWAKTEMNPVTKLVRMFRPQKPHTRSIKYDSVGFTVSFDGVPSAVVRWDQVSEIVAFKEDLFAYDSVCFGFRCDESGVYESVGEHEVDFEAFSKEVVAHFSGFRTDWHEVVIQPPFAENWTVVWQNDPVKKGPIRKAGMIRRDR